jgi:hypothetical protein
MALIDDVKAICDRLAPLGWRTLLLRATNQQLDIVQSSAAKLRAELSKSLTAINRGVAGFEDFSITGTRGIMPGRPGESLLYHALASPGVVRGLKGFPTEREIETVENFVFGITLPTLAQLRTRAGLGENERFSIVVFAYEYRTARDTCSRLQADLAFSRTGVARVGTAPARYEARNRGYLPEVSGDAFQFRVCPARYGAFLAVSRRGNAQSFTPMRTRPGDRTADFWMPLHKLFSGNECIAGLNLNVAFSAFHYNDKIRRTRSVTLRMPNVPAVPPFQFSDGIAELSGNSADPAGLLFPVVHARLIEPAQHNGAPLTYPVPRANSGFAALEPGATMLDGMEVRPAPAYVHARTEVRNGAMVNLNNDATRPDVLATVSGGNYQALHYVDFTGDGTIDVAIAALANRPEVAPVTVPCYSLVAAPDFFPSTGQRELIENVPDALWGVPPIPLCDTRLPPNLQMPGNRFRADDITVSAIVPLWNTTPSAVTLPASKEPNRHSSLPDECAGVYAPGWDVSTDRASIGGTNVHHLAAYGLGSPFPEDAKLCAALSTFWPTVAPDATRGMSPNSGSRQLRATVAPLADAEIGQVGQLPWDGVRGPAIIRLNGEDFLECEDFLHVDYVQEALQGRFSPRLLARVGSEEYADRMFAMGIAYEIVGGNRNLRFVNSFRRVTSGDEELAQAESDASAQLSGTVYRIELFRGGESTQRDHPTDFRKKILPMTDRRFFFVSPSQRAALERRPAAAKWTAVALAP